jgi:hypothetical protein
MIAFASIQAAAKNGWALLPLLPTVFMAFHFSYGIGMLAGFLSRPPAIGRAGGQESMFTRISR